MKQGRTPDRVHVVRPMHDEETAQHQPAARVSPAPPRTDLPAPPPPAAGRGEGRGVELIRTLAQISDKLKRSEAERYELLAELREYRKALNALEDKTEQTEKAYEQLQNKIQSRESAETDLAQRQARFERALKETEGKLIQAVAGQALLDKRLKEGETVQGVLLERIDNQVGEQTRLERQLDKLGQDKSRMLRKVERMEEILTETQDTLKARALVLLTDQSAAVQGQLAQVPALGRDDEFAQNAGTHAQHEAPWWRRSVRMQGVGMASMVVAALLFGWTINQVQQPDIPKIAVLENGGLARINLQENRWEPIAREQELSLPATSVSATAQENAPTAVEAEDAAPGEDAGPDAAPGMTVEDIQSLDVLSASDEALLEALEADPDALAAQLNAIEPSVQAALELDGPADIAPVMEEPVAQVDIAGIYNPLTPYEAKAYAQDPQIASQIAAAREAAPLMQRVARDENLPEAIRPLEDQAFSGVPEAQHDLAAIYTAGRAGVAQNFETAGAWFAEAAVGGVANAAYNLGVLYHQGLGVERDLDRALYWYREAAKGGHPEAQYNLGIAYIEGIGTEYDAEIAAAFFESAANQGIIEAAYNLGLIHENGLMRRSSQEDAIMWYKVAADGGNNDAQAALRQMASALQIGMDDVARMAQRMQSIYQANHGRRAGAEG